MEWPEIFKHFALYSVLTSWAFGYWLWSRTKHVNARTISKSGASSKTSYIIFALGVTVSEILLAFNVYGYMLQRTSMPSSLFILFGITFLSLFLTAWVPDTKGLANKIHHWTAYIMSYLLLTLAGLLFVDGYDSFAKGGNNVDGNMHAIGILFVVTLAAVGTYRQRKEITAKQSLYSQQLYFLVFQLAILARIYL